MTEYAQIRATSIIVIIIQSSTIYHPAYFCPRSITLWFGVQCVRSIMHSLMSKHAIRKLHSSIYNSNVYMHSEFMQSYATLETMLMCEYAKRYTVESGWRGIIRGSVLLKLMIRNTFYISPIKLTHG